MGFHRETCTAFLGSLGSVRDFRERLVVLSLHLHRTGLGLETEVPLGKGTSTLSPYPSLVAHCSSTLCWWAKKIRLN